MATQKQAIGRTLYRCRLPHGVREGLLCEVWRVVLAGDLRNNLIRFPRFQAERTDVRRGCDILKGGGVGSPHPSDQPDGPACGSPTDRAQWRKPRPSASPSPRGSHHRSRRRVCPGDVHPSPRPRPHCRLPASSERICRCLQAKQGSGLNKYLQPWVRRCHFSSNEM